MIWLAVFLMVDQGWIVLHEDSILATQFARS